MKDPSQIRVVGSASEAEKRRAKQQIRDAFADNTLTMTPQEVEILKRLEYPKSEKEIALINFANEETNRYLGEVGEDPFDVPISNHHMLPPEAYARIGAPRNSVAFASGVNSAIFYNAGRMRSHPVVFGVLATHEVDHLKEHNAYQLDSGEQRPRMYRRGVETLSRTRDAYGDVRLHFRGLNEGLKVIHDKASYERLLQLPELAEEKKHLDSHLARIIKESLHKKRGIPMDEFMWVGETEGDFCAFGYYEERRTVMYVCGEIQKQYPELFPSSDAVIKQFQRARYTGQYLKIASLVEDTFGKDSFRLLGLMTDESSSAVMVRDALRKRRLRVLKENH